MDYRLAGSTETDFYSNFNGEHNSTTIDEESDTGESIHDNVGKTMTTETSASAAANGFSSQTTTENYVVVPLLTMNAIIQKVTTETITEGVSGTHSSNINLLDMSGDGNQYAGGIKLNRTTGMTSVSTFTMQSPVTQTSPGVAEEKHWGANFQVSELKTFAYGSAEDPEEYSAIVKTLWTRVWGTLKLALGIVEVATGVLAVKTGVGAPFGVIAIIHGLDTMYAGATQLVSGDTTDTLTKRLANSAFLAHFKPANEQEKKELEKFGEGVDALVGIVGGLGGAGAAFQGAKQLKQGAGAAKAAAGVDDAGAAAGSLAKSSAGQNLRAAASTIDHADDVDDIANRLHSIGGELYGDERLVKLSAYLARRGVTLEVGSSRLLPGKAGSFIANPDGTATLLLKADPTKQLVWHELSHFLHWQKLGPKAYMELPRQFGNNVPEQFVFDLLERPSRWGRLSANYQDHMIDYITNIWGGVGR